MKTVRSWYNPVLQINKKQEDYVNFVSSAFNMQTPTGDRVPYTMTPYQVEYHAQSINVLKDKAPDVVFEKARGISFSFSSMVELILTCCIFQGQDIPIIAQREDSAKTLLKYGKWLINNAKLGDIKHSFKFLEKSIVNKHTGSTIQVYPSSTAADAVRSLRLIRVLIDEFAFQQRDEELMAAAQETMQSMGQMLIGSTPCGRGNLFFKIAQKPKEYGVYKLRLPVFDLKRFNPHKPIYDQPHLVPIAPWIDLQKLEKKRQRDVNIFLQENCCDFLDDSISLIGYKFISRCNDNNLLNYAKVLEKQPDYMYNTINPIYIGVDVAEKTDFTAISAFEEIKDEYGVPSYKQLFLKTLRGIELPEQQKYIETVLDLFPSTLKCRVDMTGIGLGLFEYLNRARGQMIEGIDFRRKIRTSQAKQKSGIRTFMITNLKNLIESQKISLIDDELQTAHLGAVDYSFRVARDKDKGHGDILFSNALALLPWNYKALGSKPLYTSVKTEEKDIKEKIGIVKPAILSADTTEKKKIERDPNIMSWEEKLKMLQRQRK
jgi:hypothetical protein